MAIPEEQLRKLDASLWEHEVWMKVISRSVHAMEAEAQVHETLLNLGRSQKVRDALGRIYDDPRAAKPLMDNPIAFFRSQGVDLGQIDADVTVGAASDENVLEMRVRQGSMNYKVAWHRTDGFMLMGV